MEIAEISVPKDGLVGSELDALWGRYLTGRGVEERNRLWEHYYGSALRLSRKMRLGKRRSLALTEGDLCQWAAEGLRKAIERYDPSRGVKFETYAYRKMWAGMMEGMRKSDVLSRRGRFWVKKRELGSEARKALMAGRISECRRFSECRDGDTRNEPWDIAGKQDRGFSDEWEWLMRGLTRRERLALILYYREEMTMKQVGATLGLSQSRVSQLVEGAKSIVRNRMSS